jgi:uncharacterized protein (DUF362 family)
MGNPGPSTPYERATKVNVIAASTDSVALDYWASKNILMKATSKRYSLNSMDLNYNEPGYFGYWLRLSMDELVRAGYQATVDEAWMNVYVVHMGV